MIKPRRIFEVPKKDGSVYPFVVKAFASTNRWRFLSPEEMNQVRGMMFEAMPEGIREKLYRLAKQRLEGFAGMNAPTAPEDAPAHEGPPEDVPDWMGDDFEKNAQTAKTANANSGP